MSRKDEPLHFSPSSFIPLVFIKALSIHSTDFDTVNQVFGSTASGSAFFRRRIARIGISSGRGWEGNGDHSSLLGPVNTCFAPTLLREKA
jgi:hypothetical protein